MSITAGKRPLGADGRTSRAEDRQRLARWTALVGCAAALGYGALKIIWALGGTTGIKDLVQFRAPERGLTAPQRSFDHWGTQILAGLAIVILLGLIYPWGNARFVRPVLRTLAWAGSLLAVVGMGGLTLTIGYYTGHLSNDRLAALEPSTYLFVYTCFLVLGMAFAATAWLTRR